MVAYDSTLTPPPLCEGATWGDRLPMRQIKNISHVPDRTKSYNPIPHHVGIDLVEDALTRRNFRMSEPHHYVSNSRTQFWSMYSVSHNLLPDTGGVFSWELAVRNSYDRTHSFGVGGGTRIFVCTNGMLSADTFLKTRHTANVWDRVPQMIESSMSNIFTSAEKQVLMFDKFKNLDAGGDAFVDHVIVEAMRRDIINPAGIKEVADHWRTPEHPEFKDRNVFSLMNAFTSRDRGRSPFGPNGHQKRMSTLTSMLDELYDPATDSGNAPDIVEDARNF
jgi:hypothetical protein